MLEFIAISTVILLAVISPGPDFALISRNSLCYSQKAGIMTALGIAISTLFHAAYCILGLAILISQSLLLFIIVKYIGAAYLIYLGVSGLLKKNKPMSLGEMENSKRKMPAFQAFSQGLFCNILNPKTIFFFLALFTMMIKPSMPLIIQAAYSIEIALIHFLWFSLVSIMFAHRRIKSVLGQFQHYITKIFSGALVIFGLKIATFTQR